jgi:hypothetical protein
MKKIMVVVVLFAFALMVNAQDNNQSIKDSKKAEKTYEKTGKAMVKVDDLLQPIKDYLAANYSGAKIEKAWSIDSKDVRIYKVMVTKANEKWDLSFDNLGTFIKRTAVEKGEARRMENIENKEIKATEAPKQ